MKIKGLLILMIDAAELEDPGKGTLIPKPVLKLFNEEILSIIIESDNRIVCFSSIWALIHFLLKGLWAPSARHPIYQKLADLWINELNEDFQYIITWAITSLPILEKDSLPFAITKEYEGFIKKILEYDIYLL